MDRENIRCPCCDCKSLKFLVPDRVSYHLISRGFERGYVNWVRQVEPYWGETSTHARYRDEHEPMVFEQIITDEQHDSLRDMITDVDGPGFNWNTRDEPEVPNPIAKKFFKLKDAADNPLWPGCESHSELSALSELLNIKSESNLSEKHFNRFLKAFDQMLLKGHKLPDNFYSSKKVIAPLGLGAQKIDACENDCMLYWKEDKKMQESKICHYPRFKPRRRGGKKKHKDIPFKQLSYLPLAPRLQMLCTLKTTAEHMRWHKETLGEDGKLCHPRDGEAWKHFDQTYPSFAAEPQNVRLDSMDLIHTIKGLDHTLVGLLLSRHITYLLRCVWIDLI
ncbi:UNVERIFIED_CONTAM: hypothetical protein Slati_2386700 [Sesamum latifolium]|uniref:Transposase-associated domain-containing protein n=1 Tax=Sesamum latifolium TaxID=2727402 RepID=A0AAW2WFC9_9LAMI